MFSLYTQMILLSNFCSPNYPQGLSSTLSKLGTVASRRMYQQHTRVHKKYQRLLHTRRYMLLHHKEMRGELSRYLYDMYIDNNPRSMKRRQDLSVSARYSPRAPNLCYLKHSFPSEQGKKTVPSKFPMKALCIPN